MDVVEVSEQRVKLLAHLMNEARIRRGDRYVHNRSWPLPFLSFRFREGGRHGTDTPPRVERGCIRHWGNWPRRPGRRKLVHSARSAIDTMRTELFGWLVVCFVGVLCSCLYWLPCVCSSYMASSPVRGFGAVYQFPKQRLALAD